MDEQALIGLSLDTTSSILQIVALYFSIVSVYIAGLDDGRKGPDQSSSSSAGGSS